MNSEITREYIRLFVINSLNCPLCVPKIIKFDESVWKMQAKYTLSVYLASFLAHPARKQQEQNNDARALKEEITFYL